MAFYIHAGIAQYRDCSDRMEKLGSISGRSSYWARSQNCDKRLLALSCLSVRPHGTVRLQLNGFIRNFVFEYFSQICRKNSSVIKIGQE